MRLASKFRNSRCNAVDCPNAQASYDPNRGIAHALARNLATMANLPTPIVSVIIGEGEAGAPWLWAWRRQPFRRVLSVAVPSATRAE